MSGHSKWSTIKRAKGAADAKRGALFAKISKRIIIAAKDGGDPEHNFKLRVEIEKARAASMPNDNIERAIKKGSGVDGGAEIQEVIYEGYGPFGTAFIIEAATDNKNRTVSSVKHILTKNGGSLGSQGSVAWQFSSKGRIMIERSGNNIDELSLVAIDAEADDVQESDEGLVIYTDATKLEQVKQTLQKHGAKILDTEVVMESSQPVALTAEQKPQVEKLNDALEEDEDVTAVYTSAIL